MSTMGDYQISGMSLDQTIDQLRLAIEQKNTSHNMYYKILERIQEIVIDEPETTGKPEILRILRALNYYRPKDEEILARQARNQGYITKEEDPISKAHLAQIKKNAFKSATPITQISDHMKEGLKLNYLKGLIMDYNPGEDEVTSKSIYDILEIYKTLFKNIELVIHEEMNRKNVDEREVLDILVGFSISGEATNVLLERIIEIIYPNLQSGKYTLHDLELIINYFPQELWAESPLHKEKANKFNLMISSIILQEIDKFSNRELLSFFQAFSNSFVFPPKLLNKLLNSLVGKIRQEELTKKEFMDFLEIYALLVSGDHSSAKSIDSHLLMTFASEYIQKKHSKGELNLNFQQVVQLYWVYEQGGILEDPTCKKIIKPLEDILNDTLAQLIAKHQPLSEQNIYEGDTQEMELDERDADTMLHYYQTFGQEGSLSNANQVIKTIKSLLKKYDDRPEKERKWFVF